MKIVGFRKLSGDDCLKIRPGSTVYHEEEPLTVKRVVWVGNYYMDVIECTNGISYPAKALSRPVLAV